jgi:hypothetical protein
VGVAKRCLLFAITGCAASPQVQTATATLAATAPQQASRADLDGREVALFVRDSTERGFTLASLLIKALRHRGIACRLVTAQSAPAPSWAIDSEQARESGAQYAARISVVTRSQSDLVQHRRDEATGRASGIVIGPSYDAAPIDFPELSPPGGLEKRDVGSDEVAEDLRLEVMASLRRVGWEAPIGRWSAAESTLRQLGNVIAPRESDPWRRVYEAVANRLADLMFDRLARDRP